MKFQIRRNFTDKKIDSIAKAIKNPYAKDNYRSMRDDPTMVIANAEHQIITYFRYFGLKIKKGIDTFEMRYERFPFLRSPSLPFTSTFSLQELDENYILKISNEVNKKKISDEEYKSLAACCSKSLEDFKKNYKNSFDEAIVFNKQQAFVDNYTLKLQASTANADGGTWMLTKTYKLTQ